MRFHYKNIDWRTPEEVKASYPSCNDFLLNDGVLVTDKGVFRIKDSARYAFKVLCESGQPVLSSMNAVLLRLGLTVTPIEKSSWLKFINHSTDPSMLPRFRYSIYPLIYSLCTGLVIILYCTSLLFTKHYITAFRPGILMKSSCLLACAQVIAINVYSLVDIFHQGLSGKCSSTKLLNDLTFSTGFNIVYLLVFLLLLLSQVSIVKRLYPRRNESRFILIIGTAMVIVTETLWATANFLSQSRGFSYASTTTTGSEDSSDDSNDDNVIVLILPVFVYLLEISLSVLYTCLIYMYCLNKKRYAFKSSMIITTLLTILAINSPIAFFFADILNVWVNKFSSFFSMASYVITNVATWEWLNQLEQVEKDDQRKNLLGRRFFIDDYIDGGYAGLGPESRSKAGLLDSETGNSALCASTQTSTSFGSSSNGPAYNLKDLHGFTVKEKLSQYRAKIEKVFVESLRNIDLRQPILLKRMKDRFPVLGKDKKSKKKDANRSSNCSLAEDQSESASLITRPSADNSSQSADRDVYIYRKKEVVFSENAVIDQTRELGISDRMKKAEQAPPVATPELAVSAMIPKLHVHWKVGKKLLRMNRSVIKHHLKTLDEDDSSLNLPEEGLEMESMDANPESSEVNGEESVGGDDHTLEYTSGSRGTGDSSGQASLPSEFKGLSFDPSVHFEFGSESEAEIGTESER